MNKLKSKFSNLFRTDGSLSQKTIRGGVWVISSLIFGKSLGFIQTVILVRLLLPSDFGLMSLASVAIGAMVVFTETGIGPAIIQRKKLSKDVLNTAWIISIARGFLLFILLFLFAPFIAHFYRNNQLEAIVKVVAAIFLLNGFNNIGIILFSKELDFKKKAFFEQIANILAFIVTVTLAFIWRNVWALVIGQVFLALITLIISYLIHPFKPSLKFNFKVAEELLQFGKHVFLSSVMIFIITNIDNALVGKVLSMTILGFYALAYNLTNIPTTAITYVISQVSVPAYSKVQDDLPRIERGYLKVLKLTSFLAIPLAGGLFILAPEFIEIVYGREWLPMIPALLVMCFLGLFRSIVATMGPVFLAIDRLYISNKIILFQLIIMLVIIYPLTKSFGMVGAAVTGIFVYLFSLIFHYCSLINIMSSLKFKILKVISKPCLFTILMVFAIWVIKHYFFIKIELFQLIFLIFFGSMFYFILSLIFDTDLIKSAKEIIF